MDASEILSRLPDDLEWMVFFRLAPIRAVADPATLRRMFFLTPDDAVESASHVVLSSAGRWLAPETGSALIPAGDAPAAGRAIAPGRMPSLGDRYRDLLTSLPAGDEDCVGLGQIAGHDRVVLQMRIERGRGSATALFEREPSGDHYELLRAVGVTYEGGAPHGDRFLARFRHLLPLHVKAGRLSDFSRTAHCNDFFLAHGAIDARLLDGLLQAATHRVRWGQHAATTVTRQLAAQALQTPMPMQCDQPPPDPAVAMGDLVPMGLMLWALDDHAAPAGNAGDSLTHDIRRWLDDRRQRGLWSFHSDRLITSTDSALVLLGRRDPSSVALLERFAAPEGGYLPQLADATASTDTMARDETNAHWCQPDYATTCLVSALRADAGLPPTTPAGWFAERFAERSGLFFANPYLVDLALALALRHAPGAADLRVALTSEILSSANADGSFGLFDQALSTALAILALDAAGYHGRAIRTAQLSLLERLELSTAWPVSTPFYSSLVAAEDDAVASAPQRVRVHGRIHELFLYRDVHRAILSAFAARAFAVAADPSAAERRQPVTAAHPRYRCATIEEYAAHALAPYCRPRVPVTVP